MTGAWGAVLWDKRRRWCEYNRGWERTKYQCWAKWRDNIGQMLSNGKSVWTAIVGPQWATVGSTPTGLLRNVRHFQSSANVVRVWIKTEPLPKCDRCWPTLGQCGQSCYSKCNAGNACPTLSGLSWNVRPCQWWADFGPLLLGLLWKLCRCQPRPNVVRAVMNSAPLLMLVQQLANIGSQLCFSLMKCSLFNCSRSFSLFLSKGLTTFALQTISKMTLYSFPCTSICIKSISITD